MNLDEIILDYQFSFVIQKMIGSLQKFSPLKLDAVSILNVPIKKYHNDFAFIVNRREFDKSQITSYFFSSICPSHFVDQFINRL